MTITKNLGCTLLFQKIRCLYSLEVALYQAMNYLAFFTDNTFTKNAVCIKTGLQMLFFTL